MTDKAYSVLTGLDSLVGTKTVEWTGMVASQNGVAFPFSKFPDKTIEVFESVSNGFNGGTITMQGTNDKRGSSDPDNAAWLTLKDLDGTPLTFTANDGGSLKENYRFVRPSPGVNILGVTCVINGVRG